MDSEQRFQRNYHCFVTLRVSQLRMEKEKSLR